ncbi:MAG: DUF4249 family protein [Bacteroidota bacterium]
MKKIIIGMLACLLLAVLASSCTKNSNSAILTAKAVVEGYLIAGKPVQLTIKMQSTNGTIDTLMPISGLTVNITHNGVSYQLNYTGSGVYANNTLIPEAGQVYNLKFIYNNETVSAETKIPSKPLNFIGSDTTITPPSPPTSGTRPTPPEPIVYTWSNPNNEYHLITVKCIETTPVEISTGAILVGGRTFRTEPTQASTQNILPMQFKYYGRHEVVLYRIQAEYAAIYDDNISNSNNLTGPPGNIVHGYGIFTGVNTADKRYIKVVQ